MTLLSENRQAIFAYHELSKHQLGKYAQGPDSLDWDLQPDPFREFKQCKRVPLPLTAHQLNVSLDDILTPGLISAQPFNAQSIGQCLELSMGLSSWKVYGGDRWSQRCNPSSGNLHPTETYLITNTIEGIDAGVYHYQVYEHSLEQRCTLSAYPATPDVILPHECILIGLSSIHWRESWKYGVRAYRYCQLDIGHAIAAICYAAASQGWKVNILEQTSDDQISRLLGLSRQENFRNGEKETPDVLLLIGRHDGTVISTLDLEPLCSLVQTSDWAGRANILSPQGTLKWPQINKVSQACHKPLTKVKATRILPGKLNNASHQKVNASQLIRQRRSAQAFDGQTSLPIDDFLRMLLVLSHGKQIIPFDCRDESAYIHPVFYIHRVQGLEAGLYVLPRSESGMLLLKSNLRDEFEWRKPEVCPEDIPLYRLLKANCRNAAKNVSCHQDIAADSALTVSMLAEFDSVISKAPWKYRQLYYEAGMLGQTLYIEAEAAGFRGTGIGCFFDDNIHEILGIHNNVLQCLYNFTVGMPVVDTRLISLPPYSHLRNL